MNVSTFKGGYGTRATRFQVPAQRYVGNVPNLPNLQPQEEVVDGLHEFDCAVCLGLFSLPCFVSAIGHKIAG